MKKSILSLLIKASIVFCLFLFGTEQSSAYTNPYYSYAEVTVIGGSGGGFSPVVFENDQGSSTTSLSAYDDCYFPPPGSSCSWTPPRAGGAARITANPFSGSISAYTWAAHEEGVAGWEVQFPGSNPFYYEPQTWGEASTFGYIRSVWEVQSSDGTLQSGDPVDIQSSFTIEGIFDNDPDSSIRALVLLNKKEDVNWLDDSEYINFGSVEDLGIAGGIHYQTDNSAVTAVDHSDNLNKQFNVGDTIVMETLFSTYSSLANDGVFTDTSADFEDTLGTSITATTSGAALVPVVPEPISSILFITGMSTFWIRSFWRKRKQQV